MFRIALLKIGSVFKKKGHKLGTVFLSSEVYGRVFKLSGHLVHLHVKEVEGEELATGALSLLTHRSQFTTHISSSDQQVLDHLGVIVFNSNMEKQAWPLD